MRKLIGVLLCTAFFAVSIQTQACEVKYETPVDIGAMVVDQVQVVEADVVYSIVPGYDITVCAELDDQQGCDHEPETAVGRYPP